MTAKLDAAPIGVTATVDNSWEGRYRRLSAATSKLVAKWEKKAADDDKGLNLLRGELVKKVQLNREKDSEIRELKAQARARNKRLKASEELVQRATPEHVVALEAKVESLTKTGVLLVNQVQAANDLVRRRDAAIASIEFDNAEPIRLLQKEVDRKDERLAYQSKQIDTLNTQVRAFNGQAMTDYELRILRKLRAAMDRVIDANSPITGAQELLAGRDQTMLDDINGVKTEETTEVDPTKGDLEID
jgi:hypothetical protein